MSPKNMFFSPNIIYNSIQLPPIALYRLSRIYIKHYLPVTDKKQTTMLLLNPVNPINP